MRRKISIFLVLFFFTFSCATFANTDTVAILVDVDGEVLVIRSGGKVEFTARNGMKIRQGDSIRTGKNASVKLDFGDGNETTVGEYSYITIAELSTIETEPSVEQFSIMSKYLGKKVTVKKQSGRTWSKVKNVVQSGNRHKVQTSTAIMGVRGTLFLTYVDPITGRTVLSVFDGQVEANGRNNDTFANSQFVNPGEEFRVDPLLDEIRPITIVDFRSVFNELQPQLGKEIVMDTIEVAEERLQQVEQTLNRLQQQASTNEEALEAMRQAAIAERQARIAARTIEAASNSPRASEINQLLQTSLAQEQQRVNQIQQRAENSRNQVNQVVDELDIPEEVVREVQEESQSIVDSVSETPQAPIGGGGDDSDSGSPSQPVHIPIQEIMLEEQEIIMDINEERYLNVIFKPENATNKSLIWETSNPNIATVEDGVVKAVSPGETVITVRTVDGNYTAEAVIYVEDLVQIEELHLLTEHVTLLKGDIYQVVPYLYPVGAQVQELVWSTSNSDVATIDDKGLVHAVDVGEATITVKTVDGIHQATMTVNVIEKNNDNKPAGYYNLTQVESYFNLEFHWHDPDTTKEIEIVGYEIYYSYNETNDFEFAQKIAQLGKENSYTIYYVPQFKNNYYYIRALYSDETISEPLELYIHFPYGIENKLSQFEPSWIIDEEKYSGIKYEISDTNNPVDFYELNLNYFDQKIEQIIITASQRYIVLDDLNFWWYLLNIEDVEIVEVYFKDKFDDPPDLVDYGIILEGDRIIPESDLLLGNSVVTSDSISFKLNDEIYSDYDLTNPRVFVNGKYVQKEDLIYDETLKTFTITKLEPDKNYWITIIVDDESYYNSIHGEIVVKTEEP